MACGGFFLSLVLKVHPAYAHLGLQRALLQCAEERAGQFIPQARADARISLSASCSGPTNIYRQAIEQADFALVRSDLRMEIDLSEPPPASVWPEGITRLPFTLEMARAVHEAEDEGFRDHWGYTPIAFETFQHQYMASSTFDPTLWFLAGAGGEDCRLCPLRARSGHRLGQQSEVRRPWRQRGIGLALLQTAFAEFYQRGEYKIGLEVDAQSLTGATRLYERRHAPGPPV